MQMTEVSNSEAAILSRVIQLDHDGLSAAAARAFLKLEFTADDQRRMHELAVKNQADDLTAAERRSWTTTSASAACSTCSRPRPVCPSRNAATAPNFMDEELMQLVWRRALHRCEYCQPAPGFQPGTIRDRPRHRQEAQRPDRRRQPGPYLLLLQ